MLHFGSLSEHMICQNIPRKLFYRKKVHKSIIWLRFYKWVVLGEVMDKKRLPLKKAMTDFELY